MGLSARRILGVDFRRWDGRGWDGVRDDAVHAFAMVDKYACLLVYSLYWGNNTNPVTYYSFCGLVLISDIH